MALKFMEQVTAALRKLLNKLSPGSEEVVSTVMDAKAKDDAGALAADTETTEVRELFSGACASCGRETRTPVSPGGIELLYCLDCILTGKAPTGR